VAATSVVLIYVAERLEKAVRIDSLLKGRAERDPASQDAHRMEIGCPNTGVAKPVTHSAELIRNRLIAGPRDLYAPHEELRSTIWPSA
jgi:hypothetical protein